MTRLIILLIGILIGYMLGRQQPDRAARPAPQTTPAIKAPDDLTTIEGIGPSFAQALNDLGIQTFAQLAGQDPDDLAQRMSARVSAERIRRDGWIEQARAKAGND